MASQLERERMAESTAAYHEREYLRRMVTLINPPRAISEDRLAEITRQADYHWREAEAARVRVVAIQIEGLDLRDVLALRRAA